MKRINENKYKSGKVITSFSNYVKFLNESYSYDPDEVNKKIRRVILWLNINQGFYAELLSHVNIFGSTKLDPKTMCTNGRDIIFHPEFVMKQSEAALRLVLCHEILHCIGDHMNRRGNRNPMGWNIACDYAINPLLKDEAGFEFPVDESGNREGLYDSRFEGMRAEDIYDTLEESGELQKLIDDRRTNKIVETTGKVDDENKEISEPDPEMIIQKGDDPDQDDIQDKDPGEENKDNTEDKDPDDDTQTTGGYVPPLDDEPGGDEPGGDEPGGDEPGGDQPGGDEPGGDQPGGDQPGGDQPGGDQPGGDQPGGDQPGGEGKGKKLPRVGQKVITSSGREGIITKVYPNGDIEIS